MTRKLCEVADLLDMAQQQAAPVRQLPDEISVADAYEVQHQIIRRRLARGERLIGAKLGFTSKAKMAQMGVTSIIVGQLTDYMEIANAGTVRLSNLIHPRIEPEVAFRLAHTVGPDEDIVSCVDAVATGLEIIDSRYLNFRFSLPGVIADNTSAAAFSIGPWQPLGADLGDLPVELCVDGVAVERGTTSSILGHPLEALRALQPLAVQYALPLTGGQVILAGAATASAPLTAGVVTARIEGLGSVTVRGA